MRLMAVLNLTPDSFSDGGLYDSPEKAYRRLQQLQAEGADLVDIGAESTRPGAEEVDSDTEWHRLSRFLEMLLRDPPGIALSLDTRKPAVAARALAMPLPWEIVNDVSGCEDPDMAKILAQHPDKYLVLGHHRGIPVRGPGETVTADEVCNFLERRSARCQDMGMRRERLYGDVGFGFGKNKASNLDLLSNLSAIGKRLGLPLVAGVSRKRFLRQMWGDEGADLGSVALAAVAVCQGVEIVRCHAPKLHLPLKEIVR